MPEQEPATSANDVRQLTVSAFGIAADAHTRGLCRSHAWPTGKTQTALMSRWLACAVVLPLHLGAPHAWQHTAGHAREGNQQRTPCTAQNNVNSTLFTRSHDLCRLPMRRWYSVVATCPLLTGGCSTGCAAHRAAREHAESIRSVTRDDVKFGSRSRQYIDGTQVAGSKLLTRDLHCTRGRRSALPVLFCSEHHCAAVRGCRKSRCGSLVLPPGRPLGWSQACERGRPLACFGAGRCPAYRPSMITASAISTIIKLVTVGASPSASAGPSAPAKPLLPARHVLRCLCSHAHAFACQA